MEPENSQTPVFREFANIDCNTEQAAANNINDVLTTINNSFDNLQLINKKIIDSQIQARQAFDDAQEAATRKVSWFSGKTKAIRQLQETAVSQSKAIVSLTDSQELLFEQQKILSQCTKNLFFLCCESVVCADIAIKSITERLQQSQGEELSAVAKKELFNLIEQLKQQVSIYNRFEKLQKKTANDRARILELETNLALHNKNFCDLKNKLDEVEKKVDTATLPRSCGLGCFETLVILVGMILLFVFMWFRYKS